MPSARFEAGDVDPPEDIFIDLTLPPFLKLSAMPLGPDIQAIGFKVLSSRGDLVKSESRRFLYALSAFASSLAEP